MLTNTCQLACLHLQADLRLCRDNYRGFFEQCFAQLLKHIFGYDGSSWLDQAAQACSGPSPSALVYTQALPLLIVVHTRNKIVGRQSQTVSLCLPPSAMS